MVCILRIVYGPKWPYWIYILDYIALFGTRYAGFRQVLYLGRAPRTKETLLDFREKCRVTRHSRVFRGLTGSQRTPRVRGVTACMATDDTNLPIVIKNFLGDGHERSFSVSQEPTALYFLRRLNKFHFQNDQGESITCYVYEKYTLLRQWTTIANNVAQNNSYSKNLLQILW